jgi:hypothetical protein
MNSVVKESVRFLCTMFASVNRSTIFLRLLHRREDSMRADRDNCKS